MNRKVILCCLRRFIPLMVLATLLLILMPTSVVKADDVVTFPDPNLEASIRDAIGKPAGDILQSDLDGLTSLDNPPAGRGIVDLTGLEHCTSLLGLDLRYNQIVDISPLASLTSLVELYLGWNQISDISPLSTLTSLTDLDLMLNQISDVSPLASLTSLVELSLDGDQVSDISPLSGLTSLEYLSLDDNQVIDVSPLSGLTGLTSLALSGNQIGDNISPLASLTSLTSLFLDQNQISDVSPLAGLTSLTSWLALAGNQISDVSPLSSLTSLEKLQLDSNQISDISPLSGLTSLEELLLYSNQISDISPLSGLTSLGDLDLSSNQISDISPLSGLTSLTELYLDNNQISDIEPLVSNPGVAYGDTISLRGNPLNSTSVNTWIPALQGRVVTVYWDAPANQSPDQPSNVSPANAATSVSLTPTLQASVFSDPDSGDTHAASQWQISTTAGNYSSTVFDSSTDTSHLTSINASSLNYSTTYYWHVRYQDNHGDWSIWSSETSFTTAAAAAAPPVNQPPSQPSNASPSNAATSVILMPTLQASAFSDSDTGDTHAASQWQISTTAGSYSSPVFDSSTDTSHLTSISAPSLNYSTAYYWHVRYQDNHGDWSSWASETSFTTLASTSVTGDVTMQGGKVETGDGRIAAEFPAGAVATTATVTIKQVEPSSAAAPRGFKVGNTFFTIEAVDADGNAIVTLSQPVAITVRYSDDDVAAAGGHANDLVLAYYDEESSGWVTLDTTVNLEEMTVSATTTHFSTWAVLAKSPSEGLPSWIWIVIGAGAAAVAGAGILTYFLRRRPRAQN